MDPTGEFAIAVPLIPVAVEGLKAVILTTGAVLNGILLGKLATDIINDNQEESENQKAGSVKQQLESNEQATSPNPIPPSPDNDDDKNGNYYESSSKHHQNAKGNISQEPQNAAEMFDKSVKDPNKPNTRWYRDKEGTFHRFQGSNHKYHWNGSTKTGTRMESIPIEIRRNLPKGDL